MEHIKEKPDQPAQIPNSTPSPPSNGFLHSSVGKESVCNAGDPGSIPRSGRSTGEGIGYPLQYSLGFPCGLAGKESACNAGDLGSIPGLEVPLQRLGPRKFPVS